MWRPRTFSTDSLGALQRRGRKPSHQNRACKNYKLTSDNNGEAFRWTSNYQIISKVYLKKHSSLPLCYSLSAADKKMVTSTMKKMVGPTMANRV